VPLTDGEQVLSINWCEISTVNEENVVDIITAGRARWKIENENNNTLKTKGYHLEHNFGHGKNTCLQH